MTEKKIKRMSKKTLDKKIAEYTEQLQALGWKGHLGSIIYGAKNYGHRYENKVWKNSVVRTTPMNCFAAIAWESPALIIQLINNDKLESFLRIVSQLAMCLEVSLPRETKLYDKTNSI
ncbi:MAG: hypothetical protein NTX91_01295 [candidate division SR1 bacterium]|nr:hypothetical protein [candidate division SR1 bacterium]